MVEQLPFQRVFFSVPSVLIVAAMSLPVKTAEADAELEALFLAEYPAAYKELEKVVDNIECSGHLIRPYYRSDVTLRVKQRSAAIIFEYDRQDRIPDYPDARVYCITPEYAFRLDKPKRSGDFVVREIGRRERQMQTAKALRLVRIYQFVFAAFYVRGKPALNIISDPSFDIVTISESTTDSLDTIEIDFVHDWSQTTEFQSGRMVFIPSLDWALTEWEIAVADKNSEAVRVDAARIDVRRWDGSGFVFPKTVEITTRLKNAGGDSSELTDRVKFEQVTLDTVEDEQFTLGAFGIPDVPLTAGKSNYPFTSKIFWILLLNAVVCAVLLFLLYRHRRETTRS